MTIHRIESESIAGRLESIARGVEGRGSGGWKKGCRLLGHNLIQWKEEEDESVHVRQQLRLGIQKSAS